MKKELGKWFMDVAKYMVTALLLSRLFNGLDDWPLAGIMLTILGIIGLMMLGLSLINMSESHSGKRNVKFHRNQPMKKGGRK